MNIDFTQNYSYLKGKKSSSSGRTSGMPLNNLPKITLAHHTHKFFFHIEKTSILILGIAITETTLLLSTLNFDLPNTLLGNTWTNNILAVYFIHLLIKRSKWEQWAVINIHTQIYNVNSHNAMWQILKQSSSASPYNTSVLELVFPLP